MPKAPGHAPGWHILRPSLNHTYRPPSARTLAIRARRKEAQRAAYEVRRKAEGRDVVWTKTFSDEDAPYRTLALAVIQQAVEDIRAPQRIRDRGDRIGRPPKYAGVLSEAREEIHDPRAFLRDLDEGDLWYAWAGRYITRGWIGKVTA